VTYIARTDLAFGGMTCIAIIMGLKSDRDRFAGTSGLVTRGTPSRRTACPAIMIAVVELHIKAFPEFCRELSRRWPHRLKVFVADRTHGTLRVCKLVQMTADARIVTGKFHLQRAAFALMARVAFELFVFGNLMRESLESRVRYLRRRWNGGFGGRDRRINALRFLKTACREDR
jgi:hypothetical protein